MKLTYGFIIGHMTLGIFFLNHNSRALKTLMLFYFLLLFSATGVCAALVTHRCSKSYWTCRPCSFPALSEFWRRRCSKTSSLQTFLQDFFLFYACTYYFISQPSKCPVFSAITLSVWKLIVHDLALKVFLWSLLTSKNLLLLKSARFWGGGAISPLRNALKKLIQFVNI